MKLKPMLVFVPACYERLIAGRLGAIAHGRVDDSDDEDVIDDGEQDEYDDLRLLVCHRNPDLPVDIYHVEGKFALGDRRREVGVSMIAAMVGEGMSYTDVITPNVMDWLAITTLQNSARIEKGVIWGLDTTTLKVDVGASGAVFPGIAGNPAEFGSLLRWMKSPKDGQFRFRHGSGFNAVKKYRGGRRWHTRRFITSGEREALEMTRAMTELGMRCCPYRNLDGRFEVVISRAWEDDTQFPDGDVTVACDWEERVLPHCFGS